MRHIHQKQEKFSKKKQNKKLKFKLKNHVRNTLP